ncbi:MAG: hypothetical protein J6A97_05270 [Clostridia bacterium]|nr:hypothetical protein [Clostridia bacterium]
MNSQILSKIADEHGVEAAQVKRDAETAIRIAADNPTPLWLELFGEGHIPTIDEFLEKVREKIQETA